MTYFLKRKILRFIYKYLLRKGPLSMPMVRYWKTTEALPAAITTNKDGATIMKMGDGDRREDYDFPGFPRGHILFGDFRGSGHGSLSVLKHTVKNQVFNYAWYALEEGKSHEEIISHIKGVSLPEVFKIIEEVKYDLIPYEKMFGAVKEVWRAMTVLEQRHPESKMIRPLKEVLTFLMSDDDAYRMRIQWIVQVFSRFKNPIENMDIALQELQHAEVVGDMKERIRLLRKGLMLLLEDQRIKSLFLEFWKEVDWKKLKLSKGDKYHLRAKYFKVDMDKFEY